MCIVGRQKLAFPSLIRAVRTWEQLEDVHGADLVARGVGQRRAHRDLGVAVVVGVAQQRDRGAEAVARPDVD